MSRAERSVAMSGAVDLAAREHLLRSDHQEDICFGLWRTSKGQTRTTALVERLILPREGERNVHGNASFEPIFLERAMAEAAAAEAGLALLHSHPLGRGWQGLSKPDVFAEQSNAGAVYGATRKPFVGLTLAGNGDWSALQSDLRDGIRGAIEVLKTETNCPCVLQPIPPLLTCANGPPPIGGAFTSTRLQFLESSQHQQL